MGLSPCTPPAQAMLPSAKDLPSMPNARHWFNWERLPLGTNEEFARAPVPSHGCPVFWHFDYIRYCVFKTGLWVFILMRKPVI